jgi:hypothetical protein
VMVINRGILGGGVTTPDSSVEGAEIIRQNEYFIRKNYFLLSVQENSINDCDFFKFVINISFKTFAAT